MQLATFTTPATAVRLVHPASDPSEAGEADKVIVAEEDVTTFPPESSTLIIGWVINSDSEAPATGEVVNTSCVARPGPVGVKEELVAEVSPLALTVMV